MAASANHERHIKRLEWAIWLSQAKLNDFREGDWVNLRQDFKEYVARSFTASIAGVLPLPREAVEELVSTFATKEEMPNLQLVQGAMKTDLSKIAYCGDDEPSEMLPLSTSPITNAEVTVEGYGPDEPFQLNISTESSTGRMIQRIFYEALVGSGITRRQLRVCPVCKTIFLLKRKPRTDMRFHCSLRCSRLAATRRYRQNLSKERERSHSRYVAKQHKKHPNAKVKRIPRAR